MNTSNGRFLTRVAALVLLASIAGVANAQPNSIDTLIGGLGSSSALDNASGGSLARSTMGSGFQQFGVTHSNHYQPFKPVPEPFTIALGAAGLALAAKRRRRAA